MAKGRAFTSLSAEDQQMMANGLNTEHGGGWKYQWKTNDIDNEFSTMDKRTQDFLLADMSQSRQRIMSQDQGNRATMTARGYDMQGKPYGPNPRYMNPKTGMIDLTSPYQDPKAQKPPPNLSGGQASVPTVAQRMSRMGEAVQKGVNKGSMKASQLDRYRQQPSAPAFPTGSTYNQGYPSAPKPVPMPQGKSRGSYSPASRPQQAYNQGYPTGQLVNYSAPKPVPMPQGKSRGS